jgi:hypothetical protein
MLQIIAAPPLHALTAIIFAWTQLTKQWYKTKNNPFAQVPAPVF